MFGLIPFSPLLRDALQQTDDSEEVLLKFQNSTSGFHKLYRPLSPFRTDVPSFENENKHQISCGPEERVEIAENHPETSAQSVATKVLFDAIENNDIQTSRNVLFNGINVNKTLVFDCETPIFQAILSGHIDIAEQLLAAGADAYAAAMWIIRRADYLCHVAHVESIRLLIAAGLDINSSEFKDDFGNSPLHHVCEYARIPLVTLFLAQGACVDHCNQYGETPLHCAALSTERTFDRLLSGSDVDEDQTELGCLPETGEIGDAGDVKLKLAVIQMLVKAGANVFAVNHRGRTPRQEAVKSGLWALADFLRNVELKIVMRKFCVFNHHRHPLPFDLLHVVEDYY